MEKKKLCVLEFSPERFRISHEGNADALLGTLETGVGMQCTWGLTVGRGRIGCRGSERPWSSSTCSGRFDRRSRAHRDALDTFICWDLDNIRPPDEAYFGSAVQAVLATLVRSAAGADVHTDVLIAGNSWTFSKVLNKEGRTEIDRVVGWGASEGMRIQIVETERRRQAVDRLIVQAIVEWVEGGGGRRLVVISNDSDFADILKYAGERGVDTVVVGTCKPTRNSNAATRKPNSKLSQAAARTIRIEAWDRRGLNELAI